MTMPIGEYTRDDVAVAGGKGANLGELVRAGLPVPPGFVVPTSAYTEFVDSAGIGAQIVALAGSDAVEAEARIRALFVAHPVPDLLAAAIGRSYDELGAGPVAVRSSATAEDLAGASFAGQQDTFLHVRGRNEVLAAVRECWASLWTARAIAYRARAGIDPMSVSLAVVVQRMVGGRSAGVLFTTDPGTGRQDRVAVSAAWGLGESVVSGSVGTDDHLVDPATGVIVARRVADKLVRTVAVPVEQGGGTRDEPVSDALRRAPVLDDAAVRELVALGVRVAEHFGTPQDVEWARGDDGAFWIVQSRPITALPEPVGDVPTDWPVPYPHGMYFRASIVEQLPDPLTPLFGDLIDGSVTRSINALMRTAFGGEVLRAGDIALPMVNGYAYYFYRSTALLRMLAGTPRALRALYGGRAEVRAGIRGWRERSHPDYVAQVDRWAGREVSAVTSTELLDGVSELLDAAAVYYTAVQSIIPVAATWEIVFTAYYDRLIRRAGDPPAAPFLLGFDSVPIRAEKSLYDLARSPRDPGWDDRFRQHLAGYGHTVYNLDFANPVPADDPGPLLATIAFFADGHGVDPHARQRRAASNRQAQTLAVRRRVGRVRRTVFDRLLRRAQLSGPVREDALADLGLAWPPMRRMLRELGRRLVDAGGVDVPDDVFWLQHAELSAAVAGSTEGRGASIGDHRADVAARRMRWRGQRRAHPPQLLPETPWFTRLVGPFMPGRADGGSGALRGIGASAGQITAPARVLDGPADFAAMRPGEVLVARITTPAWTPLFAMAAAVVTDIGGPLSHSSIVAREYGIPAVLGTGAATARIRTGDMIRVDGDTGTVILPDGLPTDGAQAPDGRPRTRGHYAVLGAALLVYLTLRRRRAARNVAPTAGSVTLLADDDDDYFSTGEPWNADR